MTDDELEDLLNGTPPKSDKKSVEARRKARRARIEADYRENQVEMLEETKVDLPDSPPNQRIMAIRSASGGSAFVEAGVIRRPVTKSWLAEALQMSPDTVAKRLTNCPVVGMAGGNRALYDFKTAVRYLLPPMMDLAEYIQCLGPNDLPNHINKIFYEGLRQKIKFEQEAGDAWATSDVLEVFGDVFITIKDQMQLWTENLRDRAALTDAQYVKLREQIDVLQNTLHEKLIEMPERRLTPSRLAQLQETSEELPA